MRAIPSWVTHEEWLGGRQGIELELPIGRDGHGYARCISVA